MSSEGKIKNLKSKLEENRLDLCMSELTVVPSSKDINGLKKVSEIDLSRNRLQTLNDDFCLLNGITFLDLSANQLRSLPEQFGKLSTLQHLDLSQNHLTDLPLSFCQLKSLRWLDLKDNPLKESLRSVAGEFLKADECKQAAQKVVRYMQTLQSDNERERQKRLKTEREAEAARKAREEEARQKMAQEKKKEKEKKKANTKQDNSTKAANNAKSNRHDDSSEETSELDTQSSKQRKQRNNVKQTRRNKSGGCVWKMCRLIFGLICALIFTIGATATFLYVNCAGQREILPKSQALCKDVYFYMSTGQVQLTWDYKATAAQLRENAAHAATHFVEAVKNTDMEAWKVWFLEWNRYVRENVVRFAKYTWKHGGEYFEIAWELIKVWAALAYEFFVIVVRRVVDLSILAWQWAVATATDVAENYPQYWEKAKYYWKNMK